MNCKEMPPTPNQMRLSCIHGCSNGGSVRRKLRMDRKTISEPTLGGWCDGGVTDSGEHFAAQARIDAPLSPINPFQRYSGRHLGGQSVCDGRDGTVHRANMVVMERRKLSKNSGLTRTTFSSLKKVSASPPLHHSVVNDYCEDMVPRSFDCCQWTAHRRHILWPHSLNEMGFVL